VTNLKRSGGNVASNQSVLRPDNPCLEAGLAALMTAEGLAEARLVRADLRHLPLAELDPDPAEAGPDVDDKLNPFTTPPMADRYLRGVTSQDDVAHLAIRGPDPWEQHVSYIAARTFRVVRQAGARALPALAVFGKGDGMKDAERAEGIRACLRAKQPFAVIDPLDSIDSFLAIDGEDRYASVAIVALNLQHVAIAVATGQTIAVGTHQTALLRLDGKWAPISEQMRMPVLRASVYAPLCGQDRGSRALQIGKSLAESDNPILLRGLVLGGLEAGYQPDCAPWEAAAMYIAAASGCVVLEASSGKPLAHPHEVQTLLMNALLDGDKVPGLIAARHKLAARRCLADLRRYGSA